MWYSKHLKDSDISRIWTLEKDSEYGVWIGDDLLIKGEFLETEIEYYGIDFNEIDWDAEYIEFSEDAYYIIKNLANGRFDAIHEVTCMDGLANSDYWYN